MEFSKYVIVKIAIIQYGHLKKFVTYAITKQIGKNLQILEKYWNFQKENLHILD